MLRIVDDPVLRLSLMQRKEQLEVSKLAQKLTEKQAASAERLLEIRAKARAAVYKMWDKRWGKED